MSILNLVKSPLSFIRKDIISAFCVRNFCSETPAATDEDNEVKLEKNEKRKVFPLEKYLRYMDSDAYKTTYGDNPVWHLYVRNYKGSLPPPTRKSCILMGRIMSATPCPICRDKYLLVDYRNVKLLKQFVSPHGGEIYRSLKTGVCQVQQRKLKVAIKKAQDYGFLTFPVPPRIYDYSAYTK